LTNIREGLEILRGAKLKGAVTAIGGPWATARGKEILVHHPWIDHVVVGEGELPLKAILNGSAPRGICRVRALELSGLPVPNYDGWQKPLLKWYADNYRAMIRSGEYGPAPKEIPAYAFYQSARGCIQIPRCAFCGVRTGDWLSPRTADQFYADIRVVRDANGGHVHIFDASDSFTSCINRFGSSGHATDGVTFTVFARTDEITPRIASILRRLGVTKVSLGIESGNNGALGALGKHTTVRQNHATVHYLAQEGINVYINYLYGVPEETSASLAQTVQHVLNLCEEGCVYRAKGRVVTPLPGSRWYRELVRAHPELDTGSYIIDTEALVKSWLAERTNIGLDDIEKAHKVFTDGAKECGVTFSNQTAVWFG